MAKVQHLSVSVAYALPEQQWEIELQLEPGATVADALERALPELPLSAVQVQQMPVGVYGELVSRETQLAQHDRVELYRPLLVDPKTARRQRAAESAAGSDAAGAGTASAPEAGK